MQARILSATPWGIEARPVQIEIDVYNGISETNVTGLHERAALDCLQRARAVVSTAGFEIPQRRVDLQIGPVDLEKSEPHLDLPITLALLAGFGLIPDSHFKERMFCGGLAFDRTTVEPVRGVSAIAELAIKRGIRQLFVPHANGSEAAALKGIRVIPVRTFGELLERIGETEPEASEPWDAPRSSTSDLPDLSEISGHEAAKRALEVAAAGGHHLVLVGPQLANKTMLARRLTGILPLLSDGEALEIQRIHSSVSPTSEVGPVTARPFRSPHPGAGTAALMGGGNLPRPGELTLAHHGVLLLDALPEFRRDALESVSVALRQRQVNVVRSRYRVDYPARFQLVATMNPCPCGHLPGPVGVCWCASDDRNRYFRGLFRRLLGRFDLQIEMQPPTRRQLHEPSSVSSREVAERVAAARQIQAARFSDPLSLNADMTPRQIAELCPLKPTARSRMDAFLNRNCLVPSSVPHVMKICRTLADLDGLDPIQAHHVDEAVQYRFLDLRLQAAG